MSKRQALTHDQNRLKVCLLCLKKKKNMYAIKNQLENDLHEYFPNYVDNEAIPAALCSSCKRRFYEKKCGGNNNLEFPDLSVFQLPKNTRSRIDLKCNCKNCEIARSLPINISGKSKDFIESENGKNFLTLSNILHFVTILQ